ncbi:MAG: hypothetical protein JW814_02875 [Candidatus Krumholzibacteriota bacterium]|nr:hypothetical protein [Candidatus Krumholzibacteriota bacterium]
MFRKSILFACAVFISIVFSGCFIQSLNHFYTDDSVIDLPSVRGQWKLVAAGDEDVSGKYTEPWIFTEEAIETFEEGVQSRLAATYFSVDGVVFVDLSAGEPSEGKGINEWWLVHVMPVHSVCRVELEGKKLSLTPLNGEWVGKLIESGKSSLSGVSRADDGEELLLTASPAELFVFLKEYKDEPEAFPEENRHLFVKE